MWLAQLAEYSTVIAEVIVRIPFKPKFSFLANQKTLLQNGDRKFNKSKLKRIPALLKEHLCFRNPAKF